MSQQRSNSLLKWSAIGVILWLLFRNKSVSDFIEFNLKNISFTGDILNPSASVILSATNKTTLPVTLTSLTGNFYLNDKTIKIGEVGTFYPVEIKPEFNGLPVDTLIEVPINILFSGVVNTIQTLISSNNAGTKIIFSGTAVCNSVTLPLNLTFAN